MPISSVSKTFVAPDPVMETDLELLGKVDTYQQSKFDAGAAALQQEVDNWALMTQIAKPELRQYANAQSREKFYTNVLLGREAQRQQFLKSLSQLARADQLKRRQNTSGNLLLKLSPAFDQFGEYNGYQYLPYLDPAVVNYNDQTVQPAKVS